MIRERDRSTGTERSGPSPRHPFEIRALAFPRAQDERADARAPTRPPHYAGDPIQRSYGASGTRSQVNSEPSLVFGSTVRRTYSVRPALPSTTMRVTFSAIGVFGCMRRIGELSENGYWTSNACESPSR